MVALFPQSSLPKCGYLPSSIPLFAQETTPAQALPEPVRQVAYMALLGIALLGMLMIVATLLGGHWVRRWGDRIRRPAVPPDVVTPKPRESHTSKSPRQDVNESRNDDLNDDLNSGETLGPDTTRI